MTGAWYPRAPMRAVLLCNRYSVSHMKQLLYVSRCPFQQAVCYMLQQAQATYTCMLLLACYSHMCCCLCIARSHLWSDAHTHTYMQCVRPGLSRRLHSDSGQRQDSRHWSILGTLRPQVNLFAFHIRLLSAVPCAMQCVAVCHI